MACAVPVVVTNAGDSALVVGNPEQVVPTQLPDARAAAWLRMIRTPQAERAALRARPGARIAWHFNVQQLAAKTPAALGSTE